MINRTGTTHEMVLPPGAFIILGCMIATKNWIDAKHAARVLAQATPLAANSSQ